jgi:hypothetical protein
MRVCVCGLVSGVNQVVGGVTLNHLAWAAALGVPCGLLALQVTTDNRYKRSTSLEGYW